MKEMKSIALELHRRLSACCFVDRARLVLLVCLAGLGLVQADQVQTLVAPVALRCEDRVNPLGIDAAKPGLSWNIKVLDPMSDIRGVKQTAYQILVASSEELLKKNEGDLWDSGKVSCDQSLYVDYAGKPLASRMRCWWKVRVWTTSGSSWSKPAFWSMGLLEPGDWSAQWITASRWHMPPDVRPPGLVVAPGGWADVDLGASFPIDSIKLYFTNPQKIPKRFKIIGADDMQFTHSQILVDQSAEDYQPIGAGPQEFAVQGARFRHIRLWIPGTPAQQEALTRQLQIFPPTPPPPQVEVRQMEVLSNGRNVALMRPTREFGTAWSHGHAVFLVDGMPSHGEGDECPPDACPTPAAPLLRKAFTVEKSVERATLYVAALGMADVTLNSQPVTDAVLGPSFTDYTKRVVYLTHEVTSLLTHGENVIGVTLGNGFFSTPRRGYGERHNGHGPPRVLIQTEVEYTDGTRQTIHSDETWKWTRSEITYNDTFHGYIEDRQLAKPGWQYPRYDDSEWLPAATSGSLGGKLVAPMGPPIRVTGELAPDRVEGHRAFFNNMSVGWPQIQVHGKAGQTITILGRPTDNDVPRLTFVLAEDGPTVLQPRFMYLSGPLALEVDGLAEPLVADAVRIRIAHADQKRTGSFDSSNPFLNQIAEHLLRTHLNYIGDQPMDPMREKQGWTQDVQSMFETAVYLTDMTGIYRKWWWDFADGQDESGYLGSILPLVGRQDNCLNSPWWSGVVVSLPWHYYQYYGDRRILAEGYDSMRRYVDFLGKLASGPAPGWNDYPYLDRGNPESSEAQEGLLHWLGAGDWFNPFGGMNNAVPAPLMNMPAWCYYASIVSDTAVLLGKKEDAAHYAAIAEEIKKRFNAEYLDLKTGLYGEQEGSQTAQVLPLALNMVPPVQRGLTYQRLLDAIHARNDHLGTGFVGLPWLIRTLIDQRETALANKIVNQQGYPGWKTLMHHGVFTETWGGGGAQMPSCGGAIGMWLYQSVLGIRPDPAGPGFKRFILAPQPDPATGLTWARGSYDSAHGRIVSHWTMEGTRMTMEVAIPPNTTATVYVPVMLKPGESGSAIRNSVVTESGRPAADAPGVTFLRMDRGAAVFEVGSGSYKFDSKLE